MCRASILEVLAFLSDSQCSQAGSDLMCQILLPFLLAVCSKCFCDYILRMLLVLNDSMTINGQQNISVLCTRKRLYSIYQIFHNQYSYQTTSYSSSYSSRDNFFKSNFWRLVKSYSFNYSFFSCFQISSNTSSYSQSSGTTSNLRIAAIPVIFLSFYPEGCSEEKMTAWPLYCFTSSQSLLMFLRLSKSLLRKRKSLISNFWTAFILMHLATYFSPQATRFSLVFITLQNSQRTLDWLMALVFSIFCITVGSAKTSLRLLRYPFEHLARMIFYTHLFLALSYFSSSPLIYLRSWSLMKPGLAITKHLILSKSRVLMIMQHYWKNLFRDFLQISSPELFLEMFLSIFFFKRVIDCFTQHRCATPSYMTMAAIQTPCYYLAISLMRLIQQSGHSSLQMVILVSSSISKVWNCPIFKKSFSLALRPLMLIQSLSSFAKQLISTICSVSVNILFLIFFNPETLVQSMIFRLVFILM